MQHARDLKSRPDSQSQETDPGFETRHAAPLMRDRSAPTGLGTLSFLFIFGREACAVAISLLAVFFQSMVAQGGQTVMAPLLMLLGCAPLLGILIFDVGYARAFSGLADLRRVMAVRARAVIAVVIAGAFTVLHPILALPFLGAIALSAMLSWATQRYLRGEHVWDFLQEEAISVLSGRDNSGAHLANTTQQQPVLLTSGLGITRLAALILALGCSTWLVAHDVLDLTAVVSIALITLWAAEAFCDFFGQAFERVADSHKPPARVYGLALPEDPDFTQPQDGLTVNSLTVHAEDHGDILSNISFRLEPGTVTAISGDSFAGKTTLLRAIIAPQDLGGTTVRGFLRAAGSDPWERSSRPGETQIAHVPARPLLIRGSGLQNLSCFSDDSERAVQSLNQLVYDGAAVQNIISSADARDLSDAEVKVLGLARAFYLRPRVLLLDRPEDGCTSALISALAARIKQERRLGTVVLMVTENRILLDLCDRMLVMQGGRLVDSGDATELRKQREIGWERMTVNRATDSEEALDSWLRAQFRRDGDERNRRDVCVIANELLAFSCSGLPADRQIEKVRFEFKHFEGHCILRMLDDEPPISSGQLTKMDGLARDPDQLKRLPPLAAVMRDAIGVEAKIENDLRVLEVKIKTFDPRKGQSGQGGAHATPQV